MPSAICPGCARKIELSFNDLDLASVRCVRCDTHLDPRTGQRVIIQPETPAFDPAGATFPPVASDLLAGLEGGRAAR